MADPRGNRPKLTQRNATAVRRYKLYEADYYTLGYDGQLFGTQHVVEYEEETPSELPPGQTLSQPAPLFKKLDEELVDEEYARLEA